MATNNITLSAGVRQNLLSLQATAELVSLTQNRLATGKKVNSALDNPANFFTSQSLSNRASDLNALLDSIGQAQQTLATADKGLTSLTKLVESAKSIAKQAQGATPAVTNYAAVAETGTFVNAETFASTTGTAITPSNTASYSFEISINGGAATAVTYLSDASATVAEIADGLETSLNAAAASAGLGANAFEITETGGALTLTALNADADYNITVDGGGGNSATNLALGTQLSTSLLDNVVAGGGTAGTSTLTVAVNGGSTSTITFGTGTGEISTKAELNTALAALTGVTASANATTVSFNVAGATSPTSLTLGGSAAVLTELGLTAGTTSGTGTLGTPSATRTNLQSQYNDLLTQITALAKDASYNGINLLNGDNLKVVFNENGTSSLTVTGVTYDAGGLGLTSLSANEFQSNTDIDTVVGDLDAALSTLRTQASKFGSNLTTVQTRQEFTKNIINTLQTGADSLVLADTNEEGANLLALQTRQQLSVTALSLSAQADQQVLRLF